MRICLITGEYPPLVGGVADYTRHLARGLTRMGLEVTVLTSRSCAPIAKADSNGDPLLPEGDEPQVLATIDRWDFRLFREIRHALDQLRPAIVHIQYQTAAYGMHPAINLLPRRLRRDEANTAFVTTLHDLRQPYLLPKAGPLRRWVTRQLIIHSHGVVTSDPEDAVMVQQEVMGSSTHGAGRRPHTALIPVGPNILPVASDTASCQEIREAWGVPPAAQVLGHFGLINHTKGIESLFQALRILLDRGLPVFLVMLGEEVGASDPTNRSYQAKLRQLARDLSLEPNIVWIGYLPPRDLSRALQALDCCLLPYTDGASYRHTTLLTALAHGLPTVTTTPKESSGTLLSNQELLPSLQDGEHCRLVTPGDVHQTAVVIEEVLSNTGLQKRLKEGARTLLGLLSWDTIAQRTAAFYQEVVASTTVKVR